MTFWNLVKVETRRLVSRRLLKVITLLVLVGITVAGTMAYVASDDSPAATGADAERERAIDDCIRSFEGHDDGETLPNGAMDVRAACEAGTMEGDSRFDYAEMHWILQGFAVPFMMLGWLVGASFMGAEWVHRGFTTTLTWEPRRIRVLGAKLVAGAAVVFVWIVGLQSIFSLSMYPAAAFEGITSGLTGAWWSGYLLLGLRIASLAVLATTFGMALGAIGKNAAAALGVGFVQLAVVEGLVRRFKPGWVDWLISDNVGLFLLGSREVNHLSRSETAAALTLLVYAVVVVATAAVVVSRREIA